jgi:hypothetical protein
LIFSRLFVGFGITATAALYAIELFACCQLFAFMTTGQMAADVEVNDHELSPS